MNIAYVKVKQGAEARHQAFCDGLAAAGYRVVPDVPKGAAKPGDVLAIWNRKGPMEPIADRFEREGGTVLVAENGYIGRDETGHQFYAIARGAHNGRGWWVEGSPERFDAMGVDLASWRGSGEHILVCPNRSFGQAGFKMPSDWAGQTVEALRRITKRPIKVRPHPGHWKRLPVHPDVSLADDLRGAWAVVVWASSAGVKALVAGVPVIRCAPWWIAAGAAGTDLKQVNDPPMPDRLPVFRRLAWAQWRLSEVSSGLPFRMLRGDPC